MTFLANLHFILQISHTMTFKMKDTIILSKNIQSHKDWLCVARIFMNQTLHCINENKWSQYITSHGICLCRNAFLSFAPDMYNYVGGVHYEYFLNKEKWINYLCKYNLLTLMKTNDLTYITSHGICLRRNAFLNFAPGMCNYVGGISLHKSNLILFIFVQNSK